MKQNKQYEINNKNVKQSVKNLEVFLKTRGFSIPHSTMLEAFSKGIFHKDWNTLSAAINTPSEDFKVFNKKTIEIISANKFNNEVDMLIATIKVLLSKANLIAKTVDFIKSNENTILIKFENGGDNFLTFLILIANYVQENKRFQVLDIATYREVAEKESFKPYLERI